MTVLADQHRKKLLYVEYEMRVLLQNVSATIFNHMLKEFDGTISLLTDFFFFLRYV